MIFIAPCRGTCYVPAVPMTAIERARAAVRAQPLASPGEDKRLSRYRRIEFRFRDLENDCPLGELLLDTIGSVQENKEQRMTMTYMLAKQIHQWGPKK